MAALARDFMFEPSHSYGRLTDYDRRRSSPVPSTTSTVTSVPPIPRVLSPEVSSPRRADRLSLRLRSNSGLTLHTNESALSQYIDYSKDGLGGRPTSAFSPSIRPMTIEEDYFSTSSRRSSWAAPSVASCLPFIDFLSQDVFQMALDSSGVSRQFMDYCRERCCEDDLEFLMRVQEYNQSTDEIASVLRSISTGWIAPAATHSLNLPSSVSRTLSADLKRLARMALPSMEALFYEAQLHVERRVAATIFPGFVANQLMRCTAAALSAGPTAISALKLEFPGLGESFCLSEASDPTNALTAVTDSFLVVSGCSLQEVIYQNSRFMQGPHTDSDAIGRIQAAIREGQSAAELIVNYRKDASPFWNLFCLYPLKDQAGRLVSWLGAQINVSDCVETRKDLLRLLNEGGGGGSSFSGDSSFDFKSSGSSSNSKKQKKRFGDTLSTQDSSCGLRRDNSLDSKSSRGRFIQQLRSRPRSSTSPAPPSEFRDPFAETNSLTDDYNNSNNDNNDNDDNDNDNLPSTLHGGGAPPLPYAAHLLLRCSPVCKAPSWQKAPPPPPPSSSSFSNLNGSSSSLSSSRKRKQQGENNNNNNNNNSCSSNNHNHNHHQQLQLRVEHCSDEAADLLGCSSSSSSSSSSDPSSSDSSSSSSRGMMGMDVFAALADVARCTNVTKSLRAHVRERVACGKATTVELAVDAAAAAGGRGGAWPLFDFGRRRSAWGGGDRGGGSGAGGGSNSSTVPFNNGNDGHAANGPGLGFSGNPRPGTAGTAHGGGLMMAGSSSSLGDGGGGGGGGHASDDRNHHNSSSKNHGGGGGSSSRSKSDNKAADQKKKKQKKEKAPKTARGGRRHRGEERLMSHWTPMRNADGDFEWVVVVLARAD
ncbi:hypothetical protein GGR56DRAFT_321750 [Xylariaceae sp. FL0804]|nr:hypothetical protein GGR56DRAFT_321750 [Xylariaceae sp. FL0804]